MLLLDSLVEVAKERSHQSFNPPLRVTEHTAGGTLLISFPPFSLFD